MTKKALDITPNLESLFGTRDENLRLMEDMLHVRIDMKSDAVVVEGSAESIARVERIFADYEALRKVGVSLQNGELNGMLQAGGMRSGGVVAEPGGNGQAAVGGDQADGAAAFAESAAVC